ncbi:diguanylate cyclase/phosphodiesterase (GGDEF & EAL domains) with PAS/PAC sensor(s), partial [hydrothermal vent metagenome]
MPGNKKKKALRSSAKSRQKPARKNKQVKPSKSSKETSEEPEHSEERYRALIDNSPVCIHEIDMDGALISMNAAGLAMLGIKKESEIVGMAYLQAVCEKDRERIEKLLDRALKGRSSQFELTSSGSKPRFFSSCFIPIKSKGGKVVRLMGVTEDITERKRAEETILNRANQQKVVSELGLLALSNIELSELFDKTVNVLAQTLSVEYCKVLELLPDGKALLLRSGVGWRRAIVGQTTVGAQKESHAGYTLLSDKPVIVDDSRTETRFSSPALLRDHNVVSGVSVIIEGEDKPYGVLGAHTAKRQLFTQDDINFLQSIANILAIAIERKKVEEALREAKEKAESATKEKDKYISLIAHNLKSPFTSIVTLLELLSSEKDDPAIVKHRMLIDAVRDTSEYAMKVIDDVLRVSRFESGKIELKPGFMDGNIEAFTVIATHGHLAREKGIELVNKAPSNTRLYADYSLFREVLSNLAYNAIKFCRRGDTITFYVPSGE